jgi:hypothetical protein
MQLLGAAFLVTLLSGCSASYDDLSNAFPGDERLW